MNNQTEQPAAIATGPAPDGAKQEAAVRLGDGSSSQTGAVLEARGASQAGAAVRIGWGEADLTPPEPVMLAGQFYARLSEGVADPLQATVWAIEAGADQAVFVACDLISVSNELRDAVRERLSGREDGLDPAKIVLHATHTHTAPETRPESRQAAHLRGGASGLDLAGMPIEAYVEFAAERIAMAIEQAWGTRAPGAFAYGVGQAVVGRNRRWVNERGQSVMYGLQPAVFDSFRHIEGCEDHAVQVLATYDAAGELSGVVVNVACPSQVSEHGYEVSADFWHETRHELRRRLGDNLFVLPQCSAAGDQAPRPLYGKEAEKRMLELGGRTEREVIARRIAAAVEEVVAEIRGTAQTFAELRHRAVREALPANPLGESDCRQAADESERWRKAFEAELDKLKRQPKLREEPRWYRAATNAYGRMSWNRDVLARWERQQAGERSEIAELHVVRLGDVVFATNPYELYLDFGTQIQVRSPAVQTFLVQLAGAGTYMPSPRSVMGGGYGSVPASNPVGPEGGQRLVDASVDLMQTLWEEEAP